MLGFLEFFLLEARLVASGKSGGYDLQKYVKPGEKLKLDVDHDGINKGSELEIVGSSTDANGKHHAHVKKSDGSISQIPLNKFTKPASIGNTEYARYYESLVAQKINDAIQTAKGKETKSEDDSYNINSNKSVLGDRTELIDKAKKNAEESANEYLGLLQKSKKQGGRGIELSDVESVHHTPNGINQITGDPNHSRTNNPHDVLLKLTNGQFIGASLKGGQETISNNGFGKIEIGDEKLNKETKGDIESSADNHVSIFNSQTSGNKRKHLKTLFKAQPDVPLDRVGFKNKKAFAETNENSNHVRTINNNKNEFQMEHIGNGTIHISYRERGSDSGWLPLGRVAHRITKKGTHRVDATLLSRRQEVQQPTQAKPRKRTPVLDQSGRIDHGHVTTNAPY